MDRVCYRDLRRDDRCLVLWACQRYLDSSCYHWILHFWVGTHRGCGYLAYLSPLWNERNYFAAGIQRLCWRPLQVLRQGLLVYERPHLIRTSLMETPALSIPRDVQLQLYQWIESLSNLLLHSAASHSFQASLRSELYKRSGKSLSRSTKNVPA